jgi:hypothetical protein
MMPHIPPIFPKVGGRTYKQGNITHQFTGSMGALEKSLLKEAEKNMESKGFKSFHYLDNGEIITSMYDTLKTLRKLEPGSYKLTWLDHPENRVQIVKDSDLESAKIHHSPIKRNWMPYIRPSLIRRLLQRCRTLTSIIR